jgi:hypothetical protein
MFGPEKEMYCHDFLVKYPACALECRYYHECVTWENHVASIEKRKIERKRAKTRRQRPSGLDSFLHP